MKEKINKLEEKLRHSKDWAWILNLQFKFKEKGYLCQKDINQINNYNPEVCKYSK